MRLVDFHHRQANTANDTIFWTAPEPDIPEPAPDSARLIRWLIPYTNICFLHKSSFTFKLDKEDDKYELVLGSMYRFQINKKRVQKVGAGAIPKWRLRQNILAPDVAGSTTPFKSLTLFNEFIWYKVLR